jgi:hypothetical protein
MNIKPLHIETLFSGGIHLVWLTLLTICILGEAPDIIFNILFNLESGTAVFLFAIVFALSFFLGRVAEHFIVALNYFRKNEKGKSKTAELFEGEPAEIWGNKIFSFSTLIGLLILVIMLLSTTESWNTKRAILIIGGILILATFISFLFWFNFNRRLSNIGR